MQPNTWYTKEEIDKMEPYLCDGMLDVVSYKSTDYGNGCYYQMNDLFNARYDDRITHVMLITPPPAVKKKRKK